jgi:putative YphP/YqiW family bacilliredoxin
MYPAELVAPMKGELTNVGFKQLESAQDVDAALSSTEGTTLLVFNSVCGCAAGAARPGVKLAFTANAKLPTQLRNRICRCR